MVISLLFLLVHFNSSAHALQSVPSRAAFAVEIQAPAATRTCNGDLWVYAMKDRALLRLSPTSGATLSTYSQATLKLDGIVTALGCNEKQRQLIISTEDRKTHEPKSHRHSLYVLNLPAAQPRLIRLAKPSTDLIRDIACSAEQCIFLGDQVYAVDVRSFSNGAPLTLKPLELPSPPMTQPAQQKHMLFQGRFARATFTHSPGAPAQLLLLDPFRSRILSTNFKEGSEWGRWGYTEGSLMAPKGIATVGMQGEERIAIADATLKLVFFFSPEGVYQGSLGFDGKSGRFGYPLYLNSIASRLFVTDFFGNKLYAYDIPAPRKESAPSLSHISKEAHIEGSLFAHEDVLETRQESRCLSCHDGTEINSLDKYIIQRKHHPVNVAIDTKEHKPDLPLENGNLVTCSSCHDSHHEGKNGTPFYLRKPVKALCISCHLGNDATGVNHPNLNISQSCQSCHAAHGGQDYLLKDALPELCLNCHGKTKITQSHLFGRNIVTCSPCHSMHQAKVELNLARNSASANGVTCFICHKDKAELIGKSIHLGENSQLDHKWNKKEGACLDCHNPHVTRTMAETCGQCHEVKGKHPVPISISDTDRATGIHLKDETVYCGTCHEPHGSLPLNEKGRNFFRPSEPILNFCSGCHGDTARDLYQGFHKTGMNGKGP